MADPWVESLSEDWISQPHSSPLVLPSEGNISHGTPPRSSGTTRIVYGGGGGGRRNSGVDGFSTTNCRPLSFNIGGGDGGSSKDVGGEAERRGEGGEGARKETPEWKRKVLQDFGGPGGKDLFSPMRLESMFRPPTIGPSSTSASTTPLAFALPPVHRIQQHQNQQQQQQRKSPNKKSSIPVPSSPVSKALSRLSEETSSKMDTDSSRHSPSISIASSATTATAAAAAVSKQRSTPLMLARRGVGLAHQHQHHHHQSASTSSSGTGTSGLEGNNGQQKQNKNKKQAKRKPDTAPAADARNIIKPQTDNQPTNRSRGFRVEGGKGHSRNDSDEMMKKNEGISPIFTERLKQLREARKKKQLLSSSPERGRFNSTLVEDMTSQVLPTMGNREGDDKQVREGEDNILGGMKDGGGGGVGRGRGEKKQKLFFQEVESSVYPSSPPVMSTPLGGVAVQFCGDGCFEDKSFNDTTDLASTFASPNKISQAKDGEEEEVEKEYSSNPQLQALPSFTGNSKALLLPPPISQDDITTTTTSSSSSSSSFPKANNRGEEEKNQFPGSGNTIINNIRRHKDAPKSSSASAAAAKANNSPLRAHALLSNPPTQDLFPLHYPLQKKQQNHISSSPQTPPPKKSETSSGLQQGIRSSGSPLKLFHSFYDTYTNEKLRKRLGELEHSVFEQGHQKEKQTQAEEESGDEDQEDYEETFAEEDESSNISDEGSIVVNRLEKLARKQSRQESIESSRRRKNSKEHVRYSKKTFQKETTATTTTTVAIHRQISAPNTSSRRIGIEEEDNSGYRKHRRWKSDESGVNDGITGPKHPVKERTPKRIRRSNSGGGGQQRKISVKSSRSSEMAGGGRRREPEEGSILMSTSRTRSSALRTNGSRIEENPPITPTHRAVKKFIKREGTPTPGSRGKKKIPVLKLNYQYGDSVQDSPGGPSKSSPKKRPGGYKIFSGSQGDGMAGESFEMPTAAAVGGEMAETETLRKGSVTTQDFLAQAEEVMDRIRGIGLLSTRGKHGNYDGSSFIEDVQEEDEEEEEQHQHQDEGRIPSTKKKSNEKEPGAVFLDNKKRGAFDKWETTINRSPTESPGRDMREGTAERGFLLGSSESECDQDDVLPTTSALATGHLSSLRITEETNSAGSNEEDNGSSQGSLGSRSSMKVVTPVEEVLNHHLATKNTGGLTFDRKAMAWVKRERLASPEKSMDGGDNSSSATEDEDEDPFQGISDLTVDSQEERRALELARRHWEGMGNDSPSGVWKNSRMVLDDSSIMEVKDGNAGDETWGKERWNTDIGGSSFGSATGLSVRSGFTDARTETRLTSYGSHEEKLARNTRNASNADTSIMEETMVEGNETRDDIEEEGFENQENVAPPEKQSRRVVSNYTADFSSPTTATMLRQSQNALGDLPEMWNDSLEADTEGNIDGFLDHGSLRQSRRSSKTFSSGGTSYRGAARRRSGGGKTFMGRPVSRITEEEEDNGSLTFSDIEKGLRTMSLSSVLSPLPTPFASHVSIPPPPSTSRKAEVSFHMTSLPDISYQFETTEALIGLELSFMASRRGPKATAKLIEASFSIAQENLVKNLTDVEPYEPYWDYMKYLNIADKNLETLHTLNEWCPRLEELDVSGNQLGQLSGVPENVKDLKVQRNCLSGLTHWGHLLNIQYLNVSGNMLDSLEGLRALRHLRELRADDNCVESLEGVDEIEGLGVLRVRRNRLTAVDLGKAFLNRLTELDLRGNKIESIEGLDNLPALVHLNLDQNRLNDLNIPKGTRLETVRSVKLTHNFFETFDVSQFPNLRILYIDNNSLHYIDGLTRAKHLDAISCREQSPKEPSTPSTLPLERMYEARKIYLSGNPLLSPILSSFKLDFLNLQYLELASAQLTTLPKGFGHFVSNTRVLNLNYNAISDLKGLYGILRLKKLLLVGNRVRSLRKVASILGYFPALGFLDMRMNPLTVGFYPASSVRQSLLPSSSSSSDDYPKDPFTMMPGDEEKDRIFQAQMDPDTTATRRRYELTVARKCSRIKELDGLKFRKEDLRTDVDGLGVGEAVGGREKGNTASKNTKTNGTQDPVKKMAKKPGSVANTGGGRGGN